MSDAEPLEYKRWTISRDRFIPRGQSRDEALAARMLLRFRAEAHPSQHNDAKACQDWATSQRRYLYSDTIERVIAMTPAELQRTIDAFDREYAAAHARALEERNAAERDLRQIVAANSLPPHKRSPEQIQLLCRSHALGYRTEAQVRRENRIKTASTAVLQIVGGLLFIAGIAAGLLISLWVWLICWLAGWGLFAWSESIDKSRTPHEQPGLWASAGRT